VGHGSKSSKAQQEKTNDVIHPGNNVPATAVNSSVSNPIHQLQQSRHSHSASKPRNYSKSTEQRKDDQASTVSSRSLNHSTRIQLAVAQSKKVFKCKHCPCTYLDRTGLYRHTIRLHPEHTNKPKSPQVKKANKPNSSVNDNGNTVEKQKEAAVIFSQTGFADAAHEATQDTYRTATTPVLDESASVTSIPATSEGQQNNAEFTAHTQINSVSACKAAASTLNSELHGNGFEPAVEGIGQLFASESTVNLLLQQTTTMQPTAINNHQPTTLPTINAGHTDSLATAIADVFARDGHNTQLWSLPDAFLTSASDVNRWLNEITLQVLTTTVSHMSSRLRHLIVEGVANGNGNELRKIASFCMSLERISRQSNARDRLQYPQ
jgi:hypothetical protein